MVACLASLSLALCSNIIRSVASLILEASECDKDEEFSGKIEILHFLHSYAMEAAHWAHQIADIDCPWVQLVRLKRPSPALSLL